MAELRDTAEIESRLRADREKLAQSLAELRQSLSPAVLAEEAADWVQARCAPVWNGVDHAVRGNPMAAGLVGLGLVWLVLGRGSPAGLRSGEALAGTRYEAMTRWEDDGGPVAPPPEPDLDWLRETDSLGDKLASALGRLDRSVRRRMLPRADAEAQRKALMADLKRDTNRALRRGLEGLSEQAQDRIAAAREEAWLAGRNRGVVEGRPFLTGALAFGLGAGVATLFPQTRAEHRLFGRESDRLMALAQEILAEEKAHAAEVLSGFLGTLRDEMTQATESIAKGAAAASER